MSNDNRIKKEYLVEITPGITELPALKLSVDYAVVVAWIAENTYGEYIPDKHDWIEAPVSDGGAGYPQGGKVTNIKKNELGVLTMYYTTNYVAGKQASVSKTPTKGWDAGGISVDGFDGDGYFEFNATPVPRRIIAGVTGSKTPYASMQTTDASHAFYMFKHVTYSGQIKYLVRVVENGEYPTKPAALKPQFQASSSMVYRIMRVGDEITYFLFSGYGQRLYSYKSAQRSTGKLFLDVSLWRSGDYITNPVMVTPESDAVAWGEALSDAGAAAVVVGEIPSMAMSWSHGVHNEVMASIPELQASFSFVNFVEVIAEIPAMQCVLSDIKQQRVYAALPSINAEFKFDELAYSPPPEFGVEGALIFDGCARFGYHNGFSIDASLPVIAGAFTPSGYFSVAGIIPSMTMAMDDGTKLEDTALIKNVYRDESLGMGSSFIVDPVMYVSVGSGLGFEFDGNNVLCLDVTIVFDQSMSYGLSLDTETEFTRTILDMIQSGAVFGGIVDEQDIQDIQDIQYACNSANAALSTYRNFNFDSFASTDHGVYGLRDGCIYKIRPGDDDGFMRDHVIDFGDTDFGSTIKKNVDSVYFEMSSNADQVFAKITGDNGEPYTYSVTQYGSTRRAIVGRGLTAKSWSLRLELQGASEFELDSVEYSVAMPAQAGRRLK